MIATTFADATTIKESHAADYERITYPPSILIVADDACQAFTLKQKLEKNGCLVSWTETNLSNLAANSGEYFDLIVLNIECPDVDDLEVCKKLKADPELADIPIIMLTTRGYTVDAVIGSELPPPLYCISKDASAEARLLQTIEQTHYMIYRYM